MNKYKWIYRVIVESFIIWFIFEWENGFIISTISRWFSSIYIVIEPYKVKAIEFVIFLSPYGRKIMSDEIIGNWMHFFSIGVLIVFMLNTVVLVASAGKRFLKFIVSVIATWCEWYLLFAVTILIKFIPQEYTILCWSIAIIGFLLTQITEFGILYGVIFDKIV